MQLRGNVGGETCLNKLLQVALQRPVAEVVPRYPPCRELPPHASESVGQQVESFQWNKIAARTNRKNVVLRRTGICAEIVNP